MSAPPNRCEQGRTPDPSSARFVYSVELPTLQEMAASRIALAIWYNYIHSSRTSVSCEINPKRKRDRICDALNIDGAYWEDCEKMIESLKTARSIEEMLNMAVESVFEQTRSWIEHFQGELFSYDLAEYRIERLNADYCVWLADGKIDLEGSGRRMLSDPGLGFVHKFAIMCEFCMENEIRKVSWRDLPESFVEKVDFRRDSLVFYWICFLKNDLGAVPLGDYDSVDMVMGLESEDKWVAFEYFWNRLGIKDYLALAVLKIKRNHVYFLESILSKMSLQQQRHVISTIPDKILIIFWIRLDSPENAMWTWKNYKHSMTNVQFANVVDEIFPRKVPKQFESECRLFLEIWRSASDEQRNFVVRTSEIYIIRAFFNMADPSKTAFEFLHIFLSLQSENRRRKLLLEYAGEFGASVEDPNSMNEIVRLCLPHPDDVVRYKTRIMESHDMLRQAELLFNDVKLDRLLVKIQAYSIDAQMAEEFVKRLTDDSKYLRKNQYITKVENWNKFSRFVDEVFSQNPASGSNLKKNFIESFARVCRNDWNDDTLDETIEILNSTLTSERELQKVKQCFFESFQKSFFDYDYWPWFKEEYFVKFVLWCLNGDQDAVVEFVNKIPIDGIFDKYLSELEEWYEESDSFDDSILSGLDNCLRWYFKGIENAKLYKVGRATAYGQFKLFQMILERKDESSLNCILKWIFDQDEEAVRKFKIETIKFGEVAGNAAST